MLHGEFAMSELGDLEEVLLAIRCILSISVGCCFVVVCGGAVVVRDAHIDVAGVFTGSTSICGHTTSPARAITTSGSIGIFQRFILPAGIGVGLKGPHFADVLVHAYSWLLAATNSANS